MEDEERLHGGRQLQIQQHRITPLPARRYRGDTIDVALNDMSAQPCIRSHGALEIHAHARRPVGYDCALERCQNGGSLEPSAAHRANSETGSVDRDAVPIPKIGEGSTDAQLATRVGIACLVHFADVLYQTREQSSLANRIDGHRVFAERVGADDSKACELRGKIRRIAFEGTSGTGPEYCW